MKKVVPAITCLLLVHTTNAQFAMVPCGGTVKDSGSSITYSIGQPATNTMSNGAYKLQEGVLHPFEILEVGLIGDSFLEGLKVYPNPFQEYFKISYTGRHLQYKIYNGSGKLIQAGSMTASEIRIKTAGLAKGQYTLWVWEPSGQKSKTFKLIKLL